MLTDLGCLIPLSQVAIRVMESETMLSEFGIIVLLGTSTFVLFTLSLYALVADTELLPFLKRLLDFSHRDRADFGTYFDEHTGLRD